MRTLLLAVLWLVAALPALAEPRPCGKALTLRSAAGETAPSRLEVVNRRTTPVVLEWIDNKGSAKAYFALAPGESRPVDTYGWHAWVARSARGQCVSAFVSEGPRESWQIGGDVAGDYERRMVGSFPVYVAPEFKARDPALLGSALTMIENNARDLEAVVPAKAWRRIAGVPIWLEIKTTPPDRGAYHPAPNWPPPGGEALARAGAIEFPGNLAYVAARQPNVLMHELGHAYQDRVLGVGNRAIQAAYEKARASGRYDAVRHASGRLMRAYAMTDAQEFFAELSEAYFGRNEIFPFTREELRKFDPDSYRVIDDAWQRPETLSGN